MNGLVVPIAPGLGLTDAIDPDETSTPVGDAVTKINQAGEKKGFGTVLLPPTIVEESQPVVPRQFIEFIGWGANTSGIEFTSLNADGFRVTEWREGKFVYLDGFTIGGTDRQRRTGGSAIHFVNDDSVSPKQFNIGNVAFRQWVDPVIHCERGSPFGCIWNHLDFGWDENNGREIVLEQRQSLLGSQIRYISAGNATGDTVFYTNFAGAKVDIGFINIGGSAGQAVRLKAAVNGHVHIGGINFEPNRRTAAPIVSLQGESSTRIDYVQNSSTNSRSMIQLQFNNGNNIIGPLLNGGTLRVGKVEVTNDSAAPSYYFGSSSDIVVPSDVTANLWAFGDRERVSDTKVADESRSESGITRYSDASRSDIAAGEVAIDTNHQDTGSVVLLHRDDEGEVHRWTADSWDESN